MLPLIAGNAPRSSASSTLVCIEWKRTNSITWEANSRPWGRAVADAGMVEQVCQAHHAQADAAGFEGCFLELGHLGNIGVGVHHIIQEAGGVFSRLGQLHPVHAVVRAKMPGQVDRTQAAVLVWAEPLLTAGVGGFELVEMRDRVAAVSGIQEQQAGLAVVVRLRNDLVEQLAGRARS